MNRAWSGAWTRRQFVAGLGAAGVLAGRGSAAWAQTQLTGEGALRELMAGNERYAAQNTVSFDDLRALREKTVSKQEPFAAVLSCADSRVPVELIFDQSIGQLFVVRVAGNIVTPEVVGSLEYGVAALGVKAILVMGHASCGAVTAALQAKDEPGQISVLYQHLIPAIKDVHGSVDAAVRDNAAYQAKLLREGSTVIAKAIKTDGVKVVGGVYDLGSGRVKLVEA